MSTDVFESERSRLIAIAYGMLGSLAEAEDVVQDAWIRWNGVDTTAVESPAAYLTTVTTRLAVDRLRSARVRRETYVGPWLPEPIVTDWGVDPADVVAEAEQLSVALLAALERLNPVERAVFLLRDVFDLDYTEIAVIVERSVANCRQIARRARDHAGDHTRHAPSPDGDLAVVETFIAAAASGDLDALKEVLAADAVAWSDGGRYRHAARRPVMGAGRVATYVTNLTRRGIEAGESIRLVRVNGSIGVVASYQGRDDIVTAFEVADDVVVGIRSVLNPEKVRAATRRW